MVPEDTFTAKVPNTILEDEAFTDWEEDADGSELLRVEAAGKKS